MSYHALRKRAFTLIELLIVITIIGILAVALIPRLTGAASRARDAQRKADLQQFATALELYAQDHSGAYPNPSGPVCTSVAFTTGGTYPLTSYLTTLPADPTSLSSASVFGPGPNCANGYTYAPLFANGAGTPATGYILAATSESTTETGNSGVYQITTGGSTFNPTRTGATATASQVMTALASGYACTTTSCGTAPVTRFYIVAH